jgi:hypothetical protein
LCWGFAFRQQAGLASSQGLSADAGNYFRIFLASVAQISNFHSRILEVLAEQNGSFVLDSQQLPALQRDGHISVSPKEIVESAKIEFVSLLSMSVGKEFVDLQFTDLV